MSHGIGAMESQRLAEAMLQGAQRFEVDELEARYYRREPDGAYCVEVLVPGYRYQMCLASSLDLPSYPELIEAAHAHRTRRAPKPKRWRG